MSKRTSPILAIAAVAALASACQFGNAEPALRRAAVGEPHRTMLMIGDSLMGQHDVALPDLLEARGVDATVIDAHVNGSGVIGPVGDADSALEWVQEKVAEHPAADPVVIEWAGACAVCGTTVDGVTYPAIGDTDAGFYAMWVNKAFAIIDWLHAQGKTVVWAIPPPMGMDSTSIAIRVEACRMLAMFDTAIIAPHASRTRVDWFTALSDTNKQYATTLWYGNAFNTVRTPDLTHFTLAGSTRAATWTVDALVDVLATMPPPPAESEALPIGLIEAGDPVTLRVGRDL
jgi:hypothetical protein